jgi:DNA-binding NtrC family response regulator
VSDSAERLRTLQSGVDRADFEVKSVGSLHELGQACLEPHDLIVLDVSPTQIAAMLKLIRLSDRHQEIPVLVESTRINNAYNLAGVLPYYRAMPCSRSEIFTLLRYHGETTDQRQSRRGML